MSRTHPFRLCFFHRAGTETSEPGLGAVAGAPELVYGPGEEELLLWLYRERETRNPHDPGSKRGKLEGLVPSSILDDSL